MAREVRGVWTQQIAEVVGRMRPDEHRGEQDEGEGSRDQHHQHDVADVLEPPELRHQALSDRPSGLAERKRASAGVTGTQERERVVELEGRHAGREIPSQLRVQVGLVVDRVGGDHGGGTDEVRESELEPHPPKGGRTSMVRRVRAVPGRIDPLLGDLDGPREDWRLVGEPRIGRRIGDLSRARGRLGRRRRRDCGLRPDGGREQQHREGDEGGREKLEPMCR